MQLNWIQNSNRDRHKCAISADLSAEVMYLAFSDKWQAHIYYQDTQIASQRFESACNLESVIEEANEFVQIELARLDENLQIAKRGKCY